MIPPRAGGGVDAAGVGARVPDDDVTTTDTMPATAATATSALMAISAPRWRRAVPPLPSSERGVDEGVDGNGGEQQREVGVREDEQLDRPLR